MAVSASDRLPAGSRQCLPAAHNLSFLWRSRGLYSLAYRISSVLVAVGVVVVLLGFVDGAAAAHTPVGRRPSNAAAPTTTIAISTPIPASTLTPSASPDSSSAAAASDSPAGASAAASTVDPAAATPSPLPKVFDTGLGSNFTSSSCPTFLRRFIDDATFTACQPLSLLMKTSDAFFSATKSVARVTQVLDASCGAEPKSCGALMASLAQQLKSSSNCGPDLEQEQPLVARAYNGLIAYAPLYQAGCLKDSVGNYCFASAVTNTSSPTDSYPYYLAVGVALPAGARPTCNKCLKDAMAIFATAAGNASQPLSRIYVGAANQINIGCGTDFVDSSVVRTSAAAASRTASPTRHLAFLTTLAALLLLLLRP